MSSYHDFLENKRHASDMAGFEPTVMPSRLFDFQQALVDGAVRRGRAALFCDCGLGKSFMQLVWAQNVIEHTNKPVLVLAPLAVTHQTVSEAAKFGLSAVRNMTGTHDGTATVVVTNYERLHLFRADDYAGVVCDESSILKNFDGTTKALVTEFLRTRPYRLLCTATAAPNDYIELGTSSEALGELGYTDMLTRFFKNDEQSIQPMSSAAKWRFKPHAERPFWRWLCSWARALRKPSDLGFSDEGFVLPPLTERVTVVQASRPMPGQLFVTPAVTLDEQRAERRLTIQERCEMVAELAGHDTYIAWCHLNAEGDLLEELIPNSVQVSGAQSDDRKEDILTAFIRGEIPCLITKPRIAGLGLNLQHCNRMSLFPSHSYEQYYQATRRCWRFGQTRPVTADIITTQGEGNVLHNLQRKAAAADRMFTALVEEMLAAQRVTATEYHTETPVWPAWIQEGTAHDAA